MLLPTTNLQRLFTDPRPTTHDPRAFTLVEVTISVAIAVVLMLGIAQVFKVVGDTVGTGEALATAQRDARATQAVFASDFNTAVTDTAPFMLLNSQQTFAFRNQADLLADKDGNPATYDPQNLGSDPQSAAIYNYRSHRIDTLTFFGRGSFARQTGADYSTGVTNGASPFVSSMGGMEALLWYGHLNLADNNGSFSPASGLSNNSPGVGTSTVGASNYYNTVNPNNYFATSWILGRQQIILAPPTALNNLNVTISPQVIDQNPAGGTQQYAYTTGAAYTSTASPALAPLDHTTIAYASATPGSTALTLAGQANIKATLMSSRLDLAATSILGFRNQLSAYGTTAPLWWTLVAGGYDTTTLNSWRFQAQPFFLTKPPTPESMALQAPIFVRGCTQFTVEYAGDFLNQNSTPTSGLVTTGAVCDTYYHNDGTAGTTDGQIDYIPVSGTGQNMVRKIRWYGLPRSTTNTVLAGSTNLSINYTNGDVTPLRDVWATATNSNKGTQAPFETTVIPVSKSDYGPQGALPAGAQYVCAWGPNDPKPKMIRITMTIDDPGGRLGDGQTYEYIYTLP